MPPRTKIAWAGVGTALLILGVVIWQQRARPERPVPVRSATVAASAVYSPNPASVAWSAAGAIDRPEEIARSGLAPTALPLAPTGDYEITVSDAELQAIVEARYGPLLRSLALPGGASERLRELLTERQHAAIDVANAAMTAGLNPIRDLPTIQRAVALAEADVDTDIERELGPSVRAACLDFETTRAGRNAVDELTRALARTAEPLDPAQHRRLVEILQGSPDPAGKVDINGVIFGRFNRQLTLSPQMVAAAAAALSPGQADALRQLTQATPSDRTTAN